MSYSKQATPKSLATSKAYYFLPGCIFMATIFNSLLVSGINRTLVDMPAWQHVGASAWAAFSRWADLQNGLILYPLEAIGGTILTIAAAIIFFINRRAMTRDAAIPIYTAVLLTLGGLLITTLAAPIMLSTPHISNPADLQRALDGFTLWEGIRAIIQALAFCANLWSLVVVSRIHLNRVGEATSVIR